MTEGLAPPADERSFICLASSEFGSYDEVVSNAEVDGVRTVVPVAVEEDLRIEAGREVEGFDLMVDELWMLEEEGREEDGREEGGKEGVQSLAGWTRGSVSVSEQELFSVNTVASLVNLTLFFDSLTFRSDSERSLLAGETTCGDDYVIVQMIMSLEMF